MRAPNLSHAQLRLILMCIHQAVVQDRILTKPENMEVALATLEEIGASVQASSGKVSDMSVDSIDVMANAAAVVDDVRQVKNGQLTPAESLSPEGVIRILAARVARTMDMSPFPAEGWALEDVIAHVAAEVQQAVQAQGHTLTGAEVTELELGLDEGFASRPGHFQR